MNRFLLLCGFLALPWASKLASAPAPERLLEIYDGRPAAPFPPEAITRSMDGCIEKGGRVELRLVANAAAGSLPANQRGVWVLMKNGSPILVATTAEDRGKQEPAGMTAKALKKARAYIAEHFETSGQGTDYHRELAALLKRDHTEQDVEALKAKFASVERKIDFKVNPAYTTPEHQAQVYGVQIYAMTLIDKETESWKISFQPASNSQGGEIWLTFDRDHPVTASFGK